MHIHKKFEVNWTKIKGSCQSYTKAAPQQSWSDLTLGMFLFLFNLSFYFCTAITDATWDERIFVKMIKCTSELGHHAESMILCQFQSEPDYVTAFKSLEERNAFDGMDALYQYLWDVTILEYAVSMHNKKVSFHIFFFPRWIK